MLTLFKRDSKQFAYFLSMSLFCFWIQSITWICRLLTLDTSGQAYLAFNYSFFYFSLAAGCFVFARWLDSRSAPSIGKIRTVIFVTMLLTCMLTYAAGFSSGYWLTCSFSMIGFSAGPIVALIQRFMITQISQNKRGAVLGCAFGTAIFVNFLLFTLFVPVGANSPIYTKTYAYHQVEFSSVVFLITGITASLFCGNKKLFLPLQQDNIKNGTSSDIKPKFIILVSLICLSFYLNVGIQDYIVTLSWFAGGNAIFFTRIFSFLGAFVVGFLCDRRGRHVLIVSSLVLLTAGLISMMFAYQGILAFMSLSLVQIAYMAFDISIKLMLADMALYSKKPVMMASLGFIFPYVMRQSGSLLGSSLNGYGNFPIFMVLILLLILPSPFLTILFDDIRNMYVNHLNRYGFQQTLNEGLPVPGAAVQASNRSTCNLTDRSTNCEDFIQIISGRCGLTAREAEVLQLILSGQTVREMAMNLYISEVTIKTHIGRILKKTGARNRSQLFSIILNTPEQIGKPASDLMSEDIKSKTAF